MTWRALALALAAFLVTSESFASPPLRVGSKRFAESYILAEIAVQTARASGQAGASHVEGLGATAIAFKALEDGEIDLYPDYTGTIAGASSTRGEPPRSRRSRRRSTRAARDHRPARLREHLCARGTIKPLRSETDQDDLRPRALSGARGRGQPRIFRTSRWMARPRVAVRARAARGSRDGPRARLCRPPRWSGRRGRCVFDRRGDREIHLRLLDDDRHFFPSYAACFLYRRDARARFPEAFAALEALRGQIDVAAMRAMNGEAELARGARSPTWRTISSVGRIRSRGTRSRRPRRR